MSREKLKDFLRDEVGSTATSISYRVRDFAEDGLDPGVDYDQLTYADGGYTYWTDFLFQGMFAATAATIVSGAVAERIKLGAFMLYAFLLLVFVL